MLSTTINYQLVQCACADEMRGASRRLLENASLWPQAMAPLYVCTHGTTILTNRGPSELVEERIFYALQVRTRTI